jgi:hypothetical protein
MSEREEREKAFFELQEKYAQTIDGLRRVRVHAIFITRRNSNN